MTYVRRRFPVKRHPERGRFSTARPMGRSQGGRTRGKRPEPVFDHSLFIKPATATPNATYNATHTFEDFGLNQTVINNVKIKGYTTPSPIQDQAIPHVMAGKDVIGIAQTGTGKTAAFLLPLLTKFAMNESMRILIIAPTRELAVQIAGEAWDFSRGLPIRGALCIGGVSMFGQLNKLRRNPHIVIGTPGRLIDLHRQEALDFSQFTAIVLDEVDRMLDMGFIKDISFIISHLPYRRQSLFFSATIPPMVRNLMDQFVNNPVTISIRPQEPSSRVNQNIIKTEGKPKVDILHELLIQKEFEKVLLFGRTKWGIEKLADELEKRGFRVAAIHGNKRQSQRQRALDMFKENRIQVLLATDIASRGIDVSGVSHVINYDLPETYEDYIHRIGRTGRADAVGNALTFVE